MEAKNVTQGQSKKAKKPDLRVTVRFSEEEYDRLRVEQYITGDSIPTQLKTAYFKGPRCSPVMNIEEQRGLLTELRRIGNNINQIAKYLNSGFREGWNDEFIQIRDGIAALRRFVGGFGGNH